ncbi:MAG: hypothetical protein AAFX39_06580 [Pseudomonadota bacterium]
MQAVSDRLRHLARTCGIWLVGGVTCVALADLPAKAQDQRRFEVEGWLGIIYDDAATGSFANCAIYADYQNGATLVFAQSSDRGWAMSVLHSEWAFETQGPHVVRFRVGRRAFREAEALAVQPHHLRVQLAADDPLIEQLRRGQTLEFGYGQSGFGFDLTGTFAALAAVRDCVTTELARPSDDDLREQIVTATPQTPGEVRRQEARSFAARLVTRLADPRAGWLMETEIPRQFSGHEAVFRTTDSVISVRILVPGRTDTTDLAADAIASHDAALCEAEADIGRPVDRAGTVRHLAIRCEEPIWTTFYSIAPRPFGGQYLISLHALDPLGAAAPRTAAIVRAEVAGVAGEMRDFVVAPAQLGE